MHIELRRLAKGVFDVAYLGDLAAYVKMNELQAINHLFTLQIVDSREQLARVKSEFALVATAFFPLAATRAGELDADAYVRTYVKALRYLGYQLQLVQLFNNKKYAASHLLSQQCQLNIALVLIPVANNQRFLINVNRQHRMQFGLTASLEADIELLAMADNLLNHRTHLVHLDRVNNEILCLIVIFLRC